jgi:hypothetical protein
VGKTHLVMALVYLATQKGHKTRFFCTADLVPMLEDRSKSFRCLRQAQGRNPRADQEHQALDVTLKPSTRLFDLG